MSSNYQFGAQQSVYFITATVVAWADVFTRDLYRHILLGSIRHCQQHQGLIVHSWVLMTNHFHMICSFAGPYQPGRVIRNLKNFTAMKLIDSIINNPCESRRSYLLDLFEKEGRLSSSNFRFKFWQHENHPVELNTPEKYWQRLHYLHNNPVKAGFVEEPADWKYSSAREYATGEKGLLPLVILS